jgi:hypothetical protein
MRRNLTISFDEGFIVELDRKRGSVSRGRWLEEASGRAVELAPDVKGGQRAALVLGFDHEAED